MSAENRSRYQLMKKTNMKANSYNKDNDNYNDNNNK